MELNLSRMAEFARRSGLAAPPCAVAHVLGTNGKGSTAAFLETVARAHGRKTGLYTSPHLVTFRERIRVDGAMPSEAQWLDAANEVFDTTHDLGLTYFEFLTAMAMQIFEWEDVDLAIMEAGLGGRYDAVNVFAADVKLYAPIGLDHMRVLGPTLADIARDKAGAISRGSGVISAPQEDAAWAELIRAARDKGARLYHSQELAALPPDVVLGLAGPHQRVNAELAVAGWSFLARRMGWASEPHKVHAGLAETFVLGRMQRCPADEGQGGVPELILDAAHNVPALEALAAALEGEGIRPAAVIFTCMGDKDLEAMAPLVAGLTNGPVIVPGLPGLDDERRRVLPSEEVVARIGSHAGRRAKAVADVGAALRAVSGLGPGPVLVCGSLYLLGALYTTRPTCLDCRAHAPAPDAGGRP